MTRTPRTQEEAIQELTGNTNKKWDWQAFGAGIMIVLVAAGIGGLVLLYNNTHSMQPMQPGLATKPPTMNEPEPPTSKTTTPQEPFLTYINNKETYHNTEQTLKGRLLHAIITNEKGQRIHRYYIVDEQGETIELQNLKEEDKQLFTSHGLTAEQHTITGIIREIKMGVALEVKEIIK